MFKRVSYFFVIVLFLVLSSCRYRLQGSGTILPNDIKSISIKPAENATTFSGLGPRFTEKIRSRFERYGVIKIVDADEPADAELVSKIVSIITRNRDVQGTTNIQVEQDLLITVSAELRRKNGQILYKNPAITANQSFGTVSGNVATTSSSFATGGLGAGTLSTLTDREVARGQGAETVESLMEEAARKIYLSAVASDF
jgi:outer membrane lipopolysaccharide assembly protein LptE/RlpB